MKNWTLRRKLQVFTGTAVGGALVLFAIGTALNLYSEQVEELDHKLEHEGTQLLELISGQADPAEWLKDERRKEVIDMLPHQFLMARDSTGKALYGTRRTREFLVPHFEAGPGFRTVRLGEADCRLAVFDNGDLQLALAVDLEEVGSIVRDLMKIFLFALPLAVFAAVFGAWWIAEKALAPISAMAKTAEEITAQRLDQRLPESRSDDEVGRLTRILNQMLDRLERAFHSANRFSADASHELKTPLTIIRGRIEEVLHGGKKVADIEPFLADLLEETTRLTGISERLLLLAKADAFELHLDLCEIDLGQLIEETLEDIEILAGEKNINVERALDPGLVVSADPGRLRQVLLNLFDNAVKYNVPGGRILVVAKADVGVCECTVANSGPAIPEADADQIFERFFRVDQSRGEVARGHGLGLSICQELVRAHGGTLELSENQQGNVEFRLRIPTSNGIKI